MTEPTHLVVGHVTKPHGNRGEVFVHPLTDHPERTFAPGVVVLPAGAEGTAPDPDLPPLDIETVRPFRTGWLVVFAGVADRSTADLLRNRYLLRPVEELEGLDEGEVFYHELLGMAVETPDGAAVGRVVEVYELSPAHMLEVRRVRGGGTVLVPFMRETVVSVDRDARRIVVDPPEGLLDL